MTKAGRPPGNDDEVSTYNLKYFSGRLRRSEILKLYPSKKALFCSKNLLSRTAR